MQESIRRLLPRSRQPRLFAHSIPPDRPKATLSSKTLRDFLVDPRGFYLSMAPAFFGFYAYFGALQAWEEHLYSTTTTTNGTMKEPDNAWMNQIHGVAGGSAGAMAAVLLGAGISPAVAVDFCSTVTLDKFADPLGMGGLFRGELFEKLMNDLIASQTPTPLLQDAVIPVAVSGYDLVRLRGMILSKGKMAKAARASACFPLLFAPVRWEDDTDGTVSYLLDGGIADDLGLEGLAAFSNSQRQDGGVDSMRVVHIVVGTFPSIGLERSAGGGTRGPSAMPKAVRASEVVSISIENTPQASPWAMKNGPRAAAAAREAMLASLDLPLYEGKEPGHYELFIDTLPFVPE